MTPCGVEATTLDFQAAQQFEASVNPVSSGLTIELSIPIRIIYVYGDNGEPIFQTWRISEKLEKANEVFDGFMNFYICGYHHINSSNYTHYFHPTDRDGLYNAYHDDNAINVYIVNSISDNNGGYGGYGSYPWSAQPNNMIWVAQTEADPYTLGHELGHYLGLFHTHNRQYSDVNNCYLLNPQDPSVNFDMVLDTPTDPGPVSTTAYCMQECPTATTPCTLTCNVNDPPATYTYVGYYTDNVMSYHNCTAKKFTQGQITRMMQYLNLHPDRAFLHNLQPACNNDIAEDGQINKYCIASSPVPDIVPIKNIQIDLYNEDTD